MWFNPNFIKHAILESFPRDLAMFIFNHDLARTFKEILAKIRYARF